MKVKHSFATDIYIYIYIYIVVICYRTPVYLMIYHDIYHRKILKTSDIIVYTVRNKWYNID